MEWGRIAVPPEHFHGPNQNGDILQYAEFLDKLLINNIETISANKALIIPPDLDPNLQDYVD